VSQEYPYVVVIGDALIDEIRNGEATGEFVGGAALNVAVGVATLGVPTTLIAMVGKDADGATIRTFLAEHGVDLVETTGPLGSSRAISDRIDGEPFYEFNAAAQARRIQFGDAERVAIAGASLVVVSCFPFDDVAQSDELIAAIEDAQHRLVIDPNPREGMMHDLALFRQTFERLARQTLLVKIGDDDASLLYDTTVAELSAKLLAEGTNTVLSTAGRDGARVDASSGAEASSPIAQLPGAIVDTMGAGDATLASVIHSLVADGVPVDGAAWGRVLDRAMLIAAATCRHEGALLRLP
jgi:sugar/nucleoside kinase (ribokinase family)